MSRRESVQKAVVCVQGLMMSVYCSNYHTPIHWDLIERRRGPEAWPGQYELPSVGFSVDG